MLYRILVLHSPSAHTPTTPTTTSYANMGFFHHDSDEAQAYEQVTNAPHKAELSHELIAAAASYEVCSRCCTTSRSC